MGCILLHVSANHIERVGEHGQLRQTVGVLLFLIREDEVHCVPFRSILPDGDDSSDYGSDNDSIEDEADEDSNGTALSTQPRSIASPSFVAEEWYRNDYPEEESDPSDLDDGPEDSDEDAFYDGRDDEVDDDINYDGPEWGND